jgi:hypothetical protein
MVIHFCPRGFVGRAETRARQPVAAFFGRRHPVTSTLTVHLCDEVVCRRTHRCRHSECPEGGCSDSAFTVIGNPGSDPASRETSSPFAFTKACASIGFAADGFFPAGSQGLFCDTAALLWPVLTAFPANLKPWQRTGLTRRSDARGQSTASLLYAHFLPFSGPRTGRDVAGPSAR